MARLRGPGRHVALLTVTAVALAMTAVTVSVGAAVPARAAPPVADDWKSEPLLLIHGYTDNCGTAFSPYPDPAHLPDGEVNAQGWLSGLGMDTDMVGYYDPVRAGGQPDTTSVCNENIDGMADPHPDFTAGRPYDANMAACDTLPDVVGEPASAYGTKDDHIDRTACLLAWYIYDTYSNPSSGIAQAVNVLAHSMGGLVVRYALGATAAHVAGFPPAPLRVLRVVTVATPHGGVGGAYLGGANVVGNLFGVTTGVEFSDMGVDSSFMAAIGHYQAPQGAGGTFWGLVGASDGAYGQYPPVPVVCLPTPPGAVAQTGNLVSCIAYDSDFTVAYPDGDGVVQSESQMAMAANVKVLYGVVDQISGDDSYTTYVADVKTQYEHEIGTTVVNPLQGPFYLNDGSTGTTRAWVCSSNCDQSDFSDLPIGTGTAVSVPGALGEIAHLLQTPVIVDVPTGGTFYTEWQTLGQRANLGSPLGFEQSIAGGERQDFSGVGNGPGAIYFSATNGTTHAIYGPPYVDYVDLGGPSSVLGFPNSDEVSTADGGQEWSFPGTTCTAAGLIGGGSAILFDPGISSASEIQGCIDQAYTQRYQGPTGPLGYPSTDEMPATGGRQSDFTGTTCGAGPFAGGVGSALYWNSTAGTVHEVTGCIYQKYSSMGGSASPLGLPTDDPYPLNGGTQQDFQHGAIFDVNGAQTVTSGTQFVVGHASHAGDDYPYETIGQFDHQDEGTDDWAEYYGQCDSFAAWKAFENLAVNPDQPPIVPDPGWIPTTSPGISKVNQITWGNADNWGNVAPANGYTVDGVPTPGAIVWWRNASTDPQYPKLKPDTAHGIGEFGHVGYVTDVYPDGSITIEQYNLRLNGEYSTLHLAFGQSAVDTSFHDAAFTVPWPAGFVHIADGPRAGAAPSIPEPASGTVTAADPSRLAKLQVVDPSSPSSQFATHTTWTPSAGHGESGAQKYVPTNGAAANATATWTPAGLAANACYRVDAFVPDNHADNPVAVYTVVDVTGTAYAAVNESTQTNDWSELGVFKTNGTGTGLSVKLDDRGPTGLFVAADAMRFWEQTGCGQQGDASPIMMPSTYYPGKSSWSPWSGGLFGSEVYSATTGTSTANRNAMWTPTHLLPYSCYDVSVYVPTNHSDNPAAAYWTNDRYYGPFDEQVDENHYGNQFAGIGTFEAYPDGTLPLELFNSGGANEYVAADAAAFVLNPKCTPQHGGDDVFGSPMTGTIIGPGSTGGAFRTTGDWSYYLGFGYADHQLYSPDNAGASATWTFSGTAGACYDIDAYVPIRGYADNTDVGYDVSNNLAGGLIQVDQNAASGWTSLVRLDAGSDGKIIVVLHDYGSTGGYTAADAIRFSRC